MAEIQNTRETTKVQRKTKTKNLEVTKKIRTTPIASLWITQTQSMESANVTIRARVTAKDGKGFATS